MASTVDAPWMTAPATRAVVAALTAGGADVRFVGGCVRDALLGRESSDIDIGTPDEPERVMALLGRADIETRTVPRGLDHGTVTALSGGQRYEITTLRRDVETDGRHAEVAFTDDWREDAARRDFTINAMSAAPEDGALHDYFGGQADLAVGRVRFVGDPATRIAEDHLRLLRFFRFYAWYGKGEPDSAALDACKAAAHTIPSLSGERVQAEMMKLLAAPDPLAALAAMQNTGVLTQLLAEARQSAHLARLIEIERALGYADPIRRLASVAASGDNPFDVIRSTVDRWRFNVDDAVRLGALIALQSPRSSALDSRNQRQELHRLGPTLFRDKVLWAWAKEEKGENAATWRAMLKTAAEWVPPEFPLTGADVLTRGVEEGPEVGRLLRTVEEWWIENDFQPDRTAALKKLDALIAENRDG